MCADAGRQGWMLRPSVPVDGAFVERGGGNDAVKGEKKNEEKNCYFAE